MRVDHIPCGECVNESERVAIERLIRELNGFGTPHQRWILLSNVPSAVNDRAIPDEIDLVCIGPSGFFVIEVKHWDRGFVKDRPIEVQHEATKLSASSRLKVRAIRSISRWALVAQITSPFQ